MTKWIAAAVTLATLMPLGTLSAQRKTTQDDDIPVFKSSSNLVLVTVYVRGKDGAPLEGLKGEDFTITENGKQQPVSVCDYQKLIDADAPAPVHQQLLVRSETPTPVAPPADTSARFKDKRLLVLYIDWSSMDAAQQLRAIEGAEKAIREQLGAGDLMALLSFSSTVTVDQELTNDKDALIKALRRHTPGLATDLTQSIDDSDTSGDDNAGYAADSSEFNLFSVDRRMAALEDVAKRYAALPEKKALIWFTADAGQSGTDNLAYIRSVSNMATRANASIYPVDVRGLKATVPGGDASTSTPQGQGLFSGKQQTTEGDRMSGSQDTLVTIAEETGGKALIDNNDLAQGVKQARADLRSYYVLGYYSSDDRKDGKYRKVEVKLNAKIAAKLDYRSGYYAEADFKRMGSEGKEKALQDALLLGDPVTDLPVAVEVNLFRERANEWFVPVAVKIPGTEIPLRKKGQAEETTSFDFLGEIRSTRKSQVALLRDNIKIRLRDEQQGTLKAHNLLYETAFRLTPGTYTLKMLVRENETGKMGTFERRIVVPAFAATDLPRSTLFLSAQREAASAAALASASGKKKADPSEGHPILIGDQRLVPSVTHVFRRAQTLAATVELYDRTAMQAVAATLAIFDANGKKIAESEPVRATAPGAAVPARPNGARRSGDFAGANGFAARRANAASTDEEPEKLTARVLVELPLKDLAAGRYTAQLNVVDYAGKRFAFPRTTFTVH